MMKQRLGHWPPILLGLLITLFISYHSYLTDFNLVPGDRGDTRLMVFTLEHWWNVLQGREAFFALNMFYPDPHALSYADGLFLFAPPYCLLRLLGANPFASYQLFLVSMTALGFLGWVWLLRRGLGVRLSFAVLGGVLLSSMNALQYQVDIGKLVGFHLYPWLL